MPLTICSGGSAEAAAAVRLVDTSPATAASAIRTGLRTADPFQESDRVVHQKPAGHSRKLGKVWERSHLRP
ncbi:hypothetical protein CS0771_75560 [Catellatospora sp. IY07-71]|nr:hypothetical protein CS0771_75560 [Catellatospora sp. IY07-71]